MRWGNLYEERAWDVAGGGDLVIDLADFPFDVVTRIEVVHDAGASPLWSLPEELAGVADAVVLRSAKIDVLRVGLYEGLIFPRLVKYGGLELRLVASKIEDKSILDTMMRMRVRFVGAVARDMPWRLPKSMGDPVLDLPWLSAQGGYLACQWDMTGLSSEDVAFAFQAMSPLVPQLELRKDAAAPTA
jgi:hypothetical protein